MTGVAVGIQLRTDGPAWKITRLIASPRPGERAAVGIDVVYALLGMDVVAARRRR
jgi:hypothetical protein